ncbi:hypothetical protein CF319_g4602 [Tilletia indica]|nr:hypothetical protein CF319_g4602 [Tilletia indica]
MTHAQLVNLIQEARNTRPSSPTIPSPNAPSAMDPGVQGAKMLGFTAAAAARFASSAGPDHIPFHAGVGVPYSAPSQPPASTSSGVKLQQPGFSYEGSYLPGAGRGALSAAGTYSVGMSPYQLPTLTTSASLQTGLPAAEPFQLDHNNFPWNFALAFPGLSERPSTPPARPVHGSSQLSTPSTPSTSRFTTAPTSPTGPQSQNSGPNYGLLFPQPHNTGNLPNPSFFPSLPSPCLLEGAASASATGAVNHLEVNNHSKAFSTAPQIGVS